MSLSHIYADELRVSITRRLAQFEVAAGVQAEGLKRAAVVIAVLPLDPLAKAAQCGEAAFLLTRRAPKLRAHGGQYALPGGRLDEGETIAEAALRELWEEVGVDLGPEAILGTLDEYPTRSGYVISPVVAWVPAGIELRPNPLEVAKVYRIPLIELRRSDSPDIFSIPETDRPLIRLPLPTMGGKINAPTAAILYQFREVALEGRLTRVSHFDQPVFAWR